MTASAESWMRSSRGRGLRARIRPALPSPTRHFSVSQARVDLLLWAERLSVTT